MPSEILITPKSGEPQILFSGSGNVTPVTLNVLSNYQSATGSGTALLFQGTQGQLLGITDNLSSGVIFSVSDITGLPLFEINASGDVRIGEYARYVGVGTGVPQFQLDVYGTGNFRGNLNVSSGLTVAGGSTNSINLSSSVCGIQFSNGNTAITQSASNYLQFRISNGVRSVWDGGFALDYVFSNGFRWYVSYGGTEWGFYSTAGTPHLTNLFGGTNPQTLRVYNTYTSTGNYEAGQLSFASNEFRIGTIEAGPGTQRQTVFGQWSAQPTGTFNHVMSISPSGSCVQIGVQDTTYYRNRLVVTTDNTSTTIGSSSISDQGIYVGNSTNTVNRPVGVQFGGQPGWAHCGIFGIMTNTGGNTGGDILLAMRVNGYSAGSLSPVARWYGPTAKVVFSGAADGTGGGNTTDTQYTFLVPNHINQISGVESPDVIFSLGSKTWASGNIPTQRFFRITAPTINNAGSGVISSGATLSIAGPPIAGSGTSITNRYALAIESGNVILSSGDLYLSRGGASTGSTPGGNIYLEKRLILNNADSLYTNAVQISNYGTFHALNANWIGIGTANAVNHMYEGNHGFFGYFNQFYGWASTSNLYGTLYGFTSSVTNITELRGLSDFGGSVNPQTLRINNTFTSTGNFETFQIKANTTQYELSSAVGATGSNRNIVIGHTNSSGTFTGILTVSPSAVKIGAYTLPTGDGTSGQVLTTNGTGVVTWSSAGGGITSINGLSGSSQSLSIASTGTDFTINSSGTSHVFSIPSASAGVRGLVTAADQTFAGIKKLSAGRVDFDNVSGPPEIPGSGGILYVDGGALKYLSAGGTTTTIAPN